MTDSSLNKRYFAKFSTNLVGLAISIVTQAIVPRGLGPRTYGDFNYLINFFNELMPFFSLSTAHAFYTKISQRQNESSLVIFYSYFTILVFISLIFFVAFCEIIGISSLLWINLDIRYVYMAVLWIILTWTTQLLTYIADANGLTVSIEIARIIQKCIGLFLIVILFLDGLLNISTFFYYHYLILTVLVILFSLIIHRYNNLFSQKWSIEKNKIKSYVGEFYNYSHPLFIYSVIGMIVSILDRWMLQKFAGSIQQGFFELSYRVGAICFIFSSAMTVLITREFSIAYAKKDIAELARLYRRYIPFLYAVAAFLGSFACIQAEKITYIMGGHEFSKAVIAVSIMTLYPIHQTYGQLGSSLFFATGQTALYRNIGVVQMLIGLPVSFLLIAPHDLLGFDTGAIGLASKFVVLQFLGVNVQLWFNTKYLRLKFSRYFIHQIICLVFMISTSIFVKIIIDRIPTFNNHVILNFLISGIVYSLFVIFFGYYIPQIFGLRREDIKEVKRRVNTILKGILRL